MNATELRKMTEDAQRKAYEAREAEAQKRAKEAQDRENEFIEGRRALIERDIQALKDMMVQAATEGKTSVEVELPTSYHHGDYRKEKDPIWLAYVDYCKENSIRLEFDSRADYELGWEMERTNTVRCYENFAKFIW